MAVLLTSKDISVEFPAGKVLDKVTLGINEGDRIGIVGKNGEGKSTLLSVLSGRYAPDSGEVIPSKNPTIGVLRQADALVDTQHVGFALVGDKPSFTWAANRKTREIVEALASDIPWDAPIGELSGGQRRRVDLARLLIGDWDILMLDEPTNHLDLRAITWLAGHLQTRWPKSAGALLVITHDRWFLNEVALRMWEVHDAQVEAFEGGFSAYIQQRVERDRLSQLSEEKRRNHLRKELAWLSRGARARSTKPKFRLKAAQELIANDPPLRNSLELKQSAMTRLGKQVFELSNLSLQFGENLVLDRLNWLVGPGDRFGILGENGVGKTSLLLILCGRLAPSSGQLKTGKTVKAALLSQRLDELERCNDDRVREVLGRHKTRLSIDGKSVTTANLLERMGFEREHLQSLVRELSGGQKRRLSLLLTLAKEPNVLILDEPGNDMDTDMLAVMEDMLDSWPGTLLLVSHDRYLMERVTDDQFALLDGRLRHLPGGVDEYLGILEERRKGSSAEKPQPEKQDAEETLKPVLSGGELYLAKKQLATLERKLASLGKALASAEAAAHELDPSDYLALGLSQERVRALQAQISELEESWLALCDSI